MRVKCLRCDDVAQLLKQAERERDELKYAYEKQSVSRGAYQTQERRAEELAERVRELEAELEKVMHEDQEKFNELRAQVSDYEQVLEQIVERSQDYKKCNPSVNMLAREILAKYKGRGG